MAEGDANSLRNQIEFLSKLINSHKTGQKPNRKPVLKNQAGLENSQKNKSWTKWKKEVAPNRGGTSLNKSSNKQLKCVRTTRQDVLKSKTVLSNENMKKIVPSSKFTYKKTLARNSPRNKTSDTSLIRSTLQISLPVKTNKAIPQGMGSSANKCLVLGIKSQPLKIPKHIQKSTSPYKLHRNNTVTKSTFPNSSTQSSSSIKQVTESPLKKVGSSLSNETRTKNKLGQSRSNYQWSKRQRTLSKSSRSISKNDLRPRTIPKGPKLKWRRKSVMCSTAPIKTMPIEHTRRPQTIVKASKLKWRRRSSTRSSSLPMKKSKLVEKKQGRPQLVHKSRYSLRRMTDHSDKNTGVHVLGVYSKTSHQWQHNAGAQFGKWKLKNRSFLSRRMKYIAHDTYTNKPHSKTSSVKHAKPGREVRIRGTNYIIGSHGKTLRKTDTAKHGQISLSKVEPSRRFRLTNLDSKESPKVVFNKMVRKKLERQNSVDKHKSERANKILRRSIQNAQASMKKDNRQKLKSQQYCMFYNKFGKCVKEKQGICPYIHDPTKIAVCTRFLRGTCQQMDGTCPFSHKVDKEKMPICQYFLKGKCTKDDCPYSHVNVGRSAVVCEDFLRGYCAEGFKCKKKHVLECEEFNVTGQCPNGAKCKLIHRQKKRKRYFQEPSTSSSLEPVTKMKKVQRRSCGDGFLPLEESTQGTNNGDNEHSILSPSNDEQTNSGETLKIRPKFTIKSSSDGCVLPRNETSNGDSQYDMNSI